MAKGMEAMAHSVTLLTAKNQALRKANEALSKRRRAKKSRIREGGALSIEDGQDILVQREVEEQLSRDRCGNGSARCKRRPTVRRCGKCGESGHNVRTCQADRAISNASNSE